MRWRPFLWLVLSLLFFIGAAIFWRLGDRWAAEAKAHGPKAEAQAKAAPQSAKAASRSPLQGGNFTLRDMTTNSQGRLARRLSNTRKPLGELMRSEHAVLLENALLDTAQGTQLPIPEHLRAKGDAGSYIVQSRQALDDAFRSLLKQAGASIVSYIPNNAYLVRASAAAAQRLASDPRTQSVLAYEPYFKLKEPLLKAAVEQTPMPEGTTLNVVLFSDTAQATAAELKQLGAEIVGADISPFGPVTKVKPTPESLPLLAALPGVKELELARSRQAANDLSRLTMGISEDSVTNANYLGLSGSNVLISMNDFGVDMTHPDLTGRVLLDTNDVNGFGGFDWSGHGTHEAGIMIGSGAESTTVTNAQGSVMPAVDGQFRGKAPGAMLLSLSHSAAISNWTYRTAIIGGFLDTYAYADRSVPDFYLQQAAARANALVSQNGWNYGNADYDISAASFDAAVRDSLPLTSGSQPLVYVFAAGNAGDGANDGTGGYPDSILSPATAKNVITVGAVEQARFITNEVSLWDPTAGTNGSGGYTTNTPWYAESDSSMEVANFSSRGNVGIGLESDFGRFKPDVVAPGSWVLSTRSSQWDQQDYYNPTSHIYHTFPKLLANTNTLWLNTISVPANAVAMTLSVSPNSQSPTPFPDLVIYVRHAGPPTNSYDVMGTNEVTMQAPSPLLVNTGWWYGISNPTAQPFSFDLHTDLLVTNQMGNYLEVLSNLNETIGPYYRYESGSSMAAAAVSGTLALMEEFFTQRLHQTNSPALMKALLINGAQPVGAQYDLQVRKARNLQGWGQVYLPTTLPADLTNSSPASGAPMLYFDQNPTNALATGQSKTYDIKVTDEATFLPLSVTLVWTDPPGDPAAATKLVNDLDLIVTNKDTGEIFLGNDIPAGSTLTTAWDTNTVPNLDTVNNVENVLLPGFGTNYSVTVVGRHVNVNAVSARPDNITQDYALVISCGYGFVSNALTLVTSEPIVSTNVAQLTFMTNSFVGNDHYSGGVLTNQHVGANPALLGTNQMALAGINPNPWGGGANGEFTFGVTNQWHFYVMTNENSFTNAAFMTVDSVELSVPRMGTTNVNNPDNATRSQPDIDLFVSTDPNILNLDSTAISNSVKSLSRVGNETIVISNAVPNGVYYIGVKSEDQMAAQYTFVGVFSLLPFSSSDQNGNQLLQGFVVPNAIPDASLDNAGKIQPGVATIYAIAPTPIKVHRAIVTNTLTHELVGDLVGTLTHGSDAADLNNHTTNIMVVNQVYVYDDSQEHNVPFAHPGDGPRTLMSFAGKEGAGQWLFQQSDESMGHIGVENNFTIFLEKQQDLTAGIIATLQPNSCREDFVDVPDNATNLTINVAVLGRDGADGIEPGGPISMMLCPLGGSGNACKTLMITNMTIGITNSLSIDIYDLPPLKGGTYAVTLCNLNEKDPATVFIQAQIYFNTGFSYSSVSAGGSPVAIQDDAVTYAYLTNLNHAVISGLDIGLLINDPRLSDLAITLISPNGTRVLLMENRGGGTTNGAGTYVLGTNGVATSGLWSTNLAPFWSSSFETAPVGLYAPGSMFEGWTALSNSVMVYPLMPAPWLSNNVLMLEYGAVSNTLPTTNSTQYQLSFNVTHAPYLVGTVSWWPLDGNGADIFGGHDGLFSGDVSFVRTGKVDRAYFGDGVATRMMVSACPDLDVGPGAGFSIEGWVNPAATNRAAPLVEWNAPTNASPEGVQFWLTGLPTTNGLPGSLWANLIDTNGVSHLVGTTSTNSVLTNGGWQHVALTFDAASLMARLYTNGQLALEQTLADTASTNPTVLIPRTWGNLYFGYHPAGGPNPGASLYGGLDEVGLYNRPLTECEVAAIFQAGSAGKYGTNVLWCPLTNSPLGNSLAVQLTTTDGNQTFFQTFSFTNGLNTNGLTWTNGPVWETDVVTFTNALLFASTNGPATNLTGLVLVGGDPNTLVDEVVLSSVVTNYLSSMLHFTDNTNFAVLPIKYGPTPYTVSNVPLTLVFSNDFENVTQQVYQAGSILPGSTNNPALAPAVWVVTNGPVIVVSNALVAAGGTNCLALSTNGVLCTLPTIGGHRYQLTYSVRGPGVVSWWNGATEPLSRRAWDLLGGNNAAYVNEATNSSPGFVGPQAYYFRGQWEPEYDPDIFPQDIDDPGSVLEVADSANLALTNSFTIEGWIRPVYTATNEPVVCGREQLFYRGAPDVFDCSGAGAPYWLALDDHLEDQTLRDLHFHIGDAQFGSLGADVFTTNSPIVVDGGTNRGWWHVAAVFERAVTNVTVINTNTATTNLFSTNLLSLYLNGVLIASNYTTRVPYAHMDPAFSPGVGIGGRSQYDCTQPYSGFMDELTVYGRALSEPELAAIYTRRRAGKADLTVAPSLSLAKVDVSVDGIHYDTGYGDNAHWTTRTVTFTAQGTNAVLALQSLLPGTLVDGITLTEIPAELNYLPESPLDVLNGEDAYGVWTLEIWDNAVGLPGMDAMLLNWLLNITALPTNPPPTITLQHGIGYTNTLVAHGVQTFIVPMPQWAVWATNALELAARRGTTNPLPVEVWFNTNQFPSFSTNDILLFSTVGSTNLTTNTTAAPWVTTGQSYYLAVTNPNSVAVDFALGVWFDLTMLTNCQAQSNFVSQAGIPRYFQFDVPGDDLPPGMPPANVNFWLSSAQTNLTMVLSQHLPLPDLVHKDYISQWPSTNGEIIMLVTNSTPFAIQTNRWYVGVFNSGFTNVPFTIQACYVTNYPTLIHLTNDVPYFASFAANTNFLAPPGAPRWFYFQFEVTNWTDGILFELYGLSGNADLVLQRESLPTMAPYFDTSVFPATNDEQIVVRSGSKIADLRGSWYLGVYNNETTNVAYTIRAVTSTNGLLVSALPLVMNFSPMLSAPGNLLLQWNSVQGEQYLVDYTDSLLPPDWRRLPLTNGGGVVASTPLSTLSVPIGTNASRFYRVEQVPLLVPPYSIQLVSGNQIRLSWPDYYSDYTLQYATSPYGPWLNLNLPMTDDPVTHEWVVYDTLGTGTKYYRLIP